MAFKENLLKKMEIEALSAQVMRTIGAPDSGSKVDRRAMVRLLETARFTLQKERDLDLYLRPAEAGGQEILVLDNELALYRTTVADVALRKSPTLKEMISIRNAVKILNDKDVVVAKRSESVKRITDELIGALDLTFTAQDVAAIVGDGAASLEKAYGEGVEECLLLLAEMLGYQRAPNLFAVKHQLIIGNVNRDENGRLIFGPMAAYNRMRNTLKWIDRRIDSKETAQLAQWRQETASEAASEVMGSAVLAHLAGLIKPFPHSKK